MFLERISLSSKAVFSQSVLTCTFSSPCQALLGSAVDVMLLMSVDSRKLVLARETVCGTSPRDITAGQAYLVFDIQTLSSCFYVVKREFHSILKYLCLFGLELISFCDNKKLLFD